MAFAVRTVDSATAEPRSVVAEIKSTKLLELQYQPAVEAAPVYAVPQVATDPPEVPGVGVGAAPKLRNPPFPIPACLVPPENTPLVNVPPV
jgi:hypothetical protein